MEKLWKMCGWKVGGTVEEEKTNRQPIDFSAEVGKIQEKCVGGVEAGEAVVCLVVEVGQGS